VSVCPRVCVSLNVCSGERECVSMCQFLSACDLFSCASERVPVCVCALVGGCIQYLCTHTSVATVVTSSKSSVCVCG